MDDYPDDLAPRFESAGAVEEPFEEWWPRVRGHFSNVPENVARHWLHEHWSHSPYSYLRSRDYKFDRVPWPADKLLEIRSTWNGFNPDAKDCIAHGQHLVEEWPHGEPYRTVAYMLERKDFPAPLIVLDNRDGHINRSTIQYEYQALPFDYVLVEGHRRFNIALYLQTKSKLNPQVDIWLMKKER